MERDNGGESAVGTRATFSVQIESIQPVTAIKSSTLLLHRVLFFGGGGKRSTCSTHRLQNMSYPESSQGKRVRRGEWWQFEDTAAPLKHLIYRVTVVSSKKCRCFLLLINKLKNGCYCMSHERPPEVFKYCRHFVTLSFQEVFTRFLNRERSYRRRCVTWLDNIIKMCLWRQNPELWAKSWSFPEPDQVFFVPEPKHIVRNIRVVT